MNPWLAAAIGAGFAIALVWPIAYMRGVRHAQRGEITRLAALLAELAATPGPLPHQPEDL